MPIKKTRTRKRPRSVASVKPQTKQKVTSSEMQSLTAMLKKAIIAGGKTALPRSITAPKENSFLGDIGQWAGNGVSKIFGLGAYKMNKNSLWSSGNQVPVMHSSSESVIFRHREYITDVSSTTAFTAYQLSVNPGLASSFPYLSTIASCFQEYKFRGLVYEFKSTGATALVSGTNTAMGTVSLVAQYRADAPALTTKSQILNEMWSVDTKTSDNCLLPIECAPKENPMAVQYVRTGALALSSDKKFYDLCTVSVATTGSQGSNVVGELWASYEVELFKPILSNPYGVESGKTDHFNRLDTGSSTMFGAINVTTPVNEIGCAVSSNSIVFPPGDAVYLLTVVRVGSSATIAQGGPTLSNCAFANVYNNSQSPWIASGGTSTQLLFSGVIYVLGNPENVNASITFASGTYPANANIDVIVASVTTSYL